MLQAAEARAAAAEAAALKAEKRAYELGLFPEIEDGPVRPAVRGVAGKLSECLWRSRRQGFNRMCLLYLSCAQGW
jgi:hypothetical protein